MMVWRPWEERSHGSYSFLTSALDRVSGQRHVPGRTLPPGKGPPYPLDRRLLIWNFSTKDNSESLLLSSHPRIFGDIPNIFLKGFATYIPYASLASLSYSHSLPLSNLTMFYALFFLPETELLPKQIHTSINTTNISKFLQVTGVSFKTTIGYLHTFVFSISIGLRMRIYEILHNIS
jgi:hypothetical protein